MVGVGVETSLIESRPTVTIVTTVELEKESDLQLNTENLSNIKPKESMNPIPSSSSRSLLDKPTNLQLLTSEEPGTIVPDTGEEGKLFFSFVYFSFFYRCAFCNVSILHLCD